MKVSGIKLGDKAIDKAEVMGFISPEHLQNLAELIFNSFQDIIKGLPADEQVRKVEEVISESAEVLNKYPIDARNYIGFLQSKIQKAFAEKFPDIDFKKRIFVENSDISLPLSDNQPSVLPIDDNISLQVNSLPNVSSAKFSNGRISITFEENIPIHLSKAMEVLNITLVDNSIAISAKQLDSLLMLQDALKPYVQNGILVVDNNTLRELTNIAKDTPPTTVVEQFKALFQKSSPTTEIEAA